MPFPQWYAGMVLTADRLNARAEHMVTQDTDQTVTDSTTYVNSQIIVPVEAGAVYRYVLLISYSAHTAGDFKWRWSVPTGTLIASFTQALVTGAGTGLNTGADIIMRRPAQTTDRIAGGTDDTSPPSNFHSAYDRGTITVSGSSGNVVMQFAQNSASSNPTILRGGNNTRLIYSRIL